MLNLAVDSKLRGCDLVRLKITDLVVAGHVKSRATIVQKKTGTPVPFELTEATRESVLAWAKQHMPKEGPWLFPSRSHAGRHMTTRQYARLVDQWIGLIGLNPQIMARTVSGARRLRGLSPDGNIRACQLLLGHTKLESTVRYLGVDVDDALNMSEQTEI